MFLIAVDMTDGEGPDTIPHGIAVRAWYGVSLVRVILNLVLSSALTVPVRETLDRGHAPLVILTVTNPSHQEPQFNPRPRSSKTESGVLEMRGFRDHTGPWALADRVAYTLTHPLCGIYCYGYSLVLRVAQVIFLRECAAHTRVRVPPDLLISRAQISTIRSMMRRLTCQCLTILT
jgi:hypothetical protein